MTTYNQTSLKTFFETGDVPTGSDFANLIDSCVNVADNTVQSIAGAFNPTELITPRVSATNGVFTGNLQVQGTLSASTLVYDAISVSAVTTGILRVTGDVSANTGTIYASANRWSSGIVSAAGSAQATGALLIYTVNFGAGVVDGQTTGFRLPGNQLGRVQYITNGGASANLWPVTGGQINALASNAAFPMVANTLYTIVHTQASGAAVK